VDVADVGRRAVGQRIALEVAPEQFDRVEVRGIGWQELEVDALVAPHEMLDLAVDQRVSRVGASRTPCPHYGTLVR
jgi:hypothetical protein